MLWCCQWVERTRHDRPVTRLKKAAWNDDFVRCPEVATGKVVGRHYRRRRRIEFFDFVHRVVAAYPNRELHVILDNLSTHKPRRDQWLASHGNVHFHYMPTHGSWLN